MLLESACIGPRPTPDSIAAWDPHKSHLQGSGLKGGGSLEGLRNHPAALPAPDSAARLQERTSGRRPCLPLCVCLVTSSPPTPHRAARIYFW